MNECSHVKQKNKNLYTQKVNFVSIIIIHLNALCIDSGEKKWNQTSMSSGSVISSLKQRKET